MTSFDVFSSLGGEAAQKGISRVLLGTQCRCSGSGQFIWYVNGVRVSASDTMRRLGWILGDSDGSPKGGDCVAGSVRSTTARAEGIAQNEGQPPSSSPESTP